jgi:hypothetical protein
LQEETTMNPTDKELEGTAIGGGDGSLGGPMIGGSLTSPDAGVIRDPVGPEVAIPIDADPGPAPIEGEPASDDRTLRDASLERADPGRADA